MCEERLVKYMCTSKLSDSNVFFQMESSCGFKQPNDVCLCKANFE